jgi:hypothetical protein
MKRTFADGYQRKQGGYIHCRQRISTIGVLLADRRRWTPGGILRNESLLERRAAAHLADADGTGEDHPLTTMNFDTDLFLFLKKS